MEADKENLYYHDHGDGVMHSHSHGDSHEHDHEHSHGDGHEHSHEETAEHCHGHTHTQTKAVLNRLSKAIGHLESVKRMVENGRDCAEVLVQLAAVRSALSSTAKVILKDHLEHCIDDDSTDAAQQLAMLNEAIDKFMG